MATANIQQTVFEYFRFRWHRPNWDAAKTEPDAIFIRDRFPDFLSVVSPFLSANASEIDQVYLFEKEMGKTSKWIRSLFTSKPPPTAGFRELGSLTALEQKVFEDLQSADSDNLYYSSTSMDLLERFAALFPPESGERLVYHPGDQTTPYSREEDIEQFVTFVKHLDNTRFLIQYLHDGPAYNIFAPRVVLDEIQRWVKG